MFRAGRGLNAACPNGGRSGLKGRIVTALGGGEPGEYPQFKLQRLAQGSRACCYSMLEGHTLF